MWKFIAVVALLLCLRSNAVTEHEENPAPPPRRESTENEIDTLKSKIKNWEVGSDWWEIAETFLRKSSKEDALHLVNELRGAQREAFHFFVKTRYEERALKIRETAYDPNAKDYEREASQREIKRRILEDQQVKLIAELFSDRPEIAFLKEDGIRRAIDEGDEQNIANILARAIGALNVKQRQNLLTRLQNEEETPFKQYLQWAVNESLQNERGTEKNENEFKDLFQDAFEKVKSKNREFHALVERALKGETDARETLHSNYDSEAVLDFIKAQLESGNEKLAIDTARAFARENETGESILDMTPKQIGFENGDLSHPSLSLGKDDTSTEHALRGFSEEEKGQFQRFEIEKDPKAHRERRIVTVSEKGDLIPKVGATPTPSPSSPSTPVTSTEKPSDQDVAPIFKQKCLMCHATGNLFNSSNLPASKEMKREIVNRILLPDGHKKRMPKEGAPPLTDAEIETIKSWAEPEIVTHTTQTDTHEPPPPPPTVSTQDTSEDDESPRSPKLPKPEAPLAESSPETQPPVTSTESEPTKECNASFVTDDRASKIMAQACLQCHGPIGFSNPLAFDTRFLKSDGSLDPTPFSTGKLKLSDLVGRLTMGTMPPHRPPAIQITARRHIPILPAPPELNTCDRNELITWLNQLENSEAPETWVYLKDAKDHLPTFSFSEASKQCSKNGKTVPTFEVLKALKKNIEKTLSKVENFDTETCIWSSSFNDSPKNDFEQRIGYPRVIWRWNDSNRWLAKETKKCAVVCVK